MMWDEEGKLKIGDVDLSGFNPKTILAGITLIRAMKIRGVDQDVFLKDLEERTKEYRDQQMSSRPNVGTRVAPQQRQQAAQKQKRNKSHKPRRPRRPPFLIPGQVEVLKSVKCECGGDVYMEALCQKAAFKHGCLRLGVCDTCNKEIKIR